MRNLRFSKRNLPGTSAAVLAFLCALAAHSVLLIPQYRTSAAQRKIGISGIEMLNIAALPGAERRELSRWIALHDPARTARSSSASGYSVSMPEPPPRSVAIHAFPSSIVRSAARISPFAPVPTDRGKFRFIPEPPENPVPFPEISRRVRILDQNGSSRFESKFSVPPGAAAEKPSVVSITRLGKVRCVTLRQSCGKPELDRVAGLFASKISPEETSTLFFFWPPEVKK